MQKYKKALYFLFVLIITIPSFISLINNSYFTMHDDTHVARLFLLDKGISQGYIFPRWVDIMGFNHGYPWFNFYPPLVYYVGEFFHLLGFSLIWSIKLTFILGFVLAAYGIFLLIKKFTNELFAILGSVLYTYFFYHGVLIYVRGALSEFFSLSILPFVFLGFENLKDKPNLKNSILFAIPIALLILTHPLIAFPTLIYLGFFFIFYLLFQSFKRLKWVMYSLFSGILGLSLSAFYWLPSMIERKFTLINSVFNKELSLYNLHYVCPEQFLTSNWGYGGSIAGCADGLTFQLGKTHIFILILSVIGFLAYLFYKKKKTKHVRYYSFFLILTFFSLFMTTEASSFIWDNISYLSYLQFPWRFLTFAALFISVVSAYGIYLLFERLKAKYIFKKASIIFVVLYSILTIILVGRYFTPQNYISKSDNELTSVEEISWRVSKSTFEFAPKGIKTTKSDFNTTVPNIQMIDIVKQPFEILTGDAQILPLQNKFMKKSFLISSKENIIFRLNTFNFPGWTAYLNDKDLLITDNNDFKLITVEVPRGDNLLEFKFEDTFVRNIANLLSIVSAGFIAFYLLSLKFKKVKS